jgi:hypothetical protein
MAEAKVQKMVDDPPVVDLGSLDATEAAESGMWLEPTHPSTGAPLDCKLLVYGEDSRAYAKAMNRIAEMRAVQQKSRRTGELTYDDAQLWELILAVNLTGDWEGLADGGKMLDCTEDNKKRVFKKHRWLADQIVTFARNRSNFLPD